MAVVQTVNFSTFCDAFRSAGRTENFSYDGLEILFNYLDYLSDVGSGTYELDVIALCCEYCKYTYSEIVKEYFDESQIEEYNALEDDEKNEFVLDYLNDKTCVVGNNEEIVVFQCF